MNRNLLGGTALAAILVASPALAQEAESPLMVSDSAMMEQRIAEIDTDTDGSISREEYEIYLDGQDFEDADRERFLAEFDEIDADADAILVVAEIEAVALATDTAAAQGGTAAQVEVTQPTAEVAVTQPAPDVNVEQGDPTVEVAQPEPEVAVTQKEPEVEVTQREPEVSVTQPEPTVAVEQGEAAVAIEQPEPQVAVDAPAPEVEVRQAQPDVEVTQIQPKVSVEQPEPEVQVETAEANVEVQTEDANVTIEQGEPEVVIQKVTEGAEVETADAAPITASTEAEIEEAEAEVEETAEEIEVAAAVATDEIKPGEDGSSEEMRGPGIPFQDLEGEAVYNNMGEEIGDISEFVMETATGDIYAVVSAGGFLGLVGDEEIVFPYTDISMNGDRVIIDTNLTEDAIEEMEGYDESRFEVVPDDMVVR